MPTVHHQVNYIEFAAGNLEKTRSFFEAVFNMNFTQWGDDYMDTVSGGVGMGFFRAPLASTQNTGGALIGFYSDDLEGSLDSVTANGGTISKEIFSFPGGRRFHFQEPSGNEFSVWSADSAKR